LPHAAGQTPSRQAGTLHPVRVVRRYGACLAGRDSSASGIRLAAGDGVSRVLGGAGVTNEERPWLRVANAKRSAAARTNGAVTGEGPVAEVELEEARIRNRGGGESLPTVTDAGFGASSAYAPGPDAAGWLPTSRWLPRNGTPWAQVPGAVGMTSCW
jgi:hypothetical protein